MRIKSDLSSPQSDDTGESHAGALRILFVTARFLPDVGGTEIHTYEVARRLAAAGHRVTVLTTGAEKRLPAEEVTDGIRVIRVPAWPPGQDLYYAPAVPAKILNETCDLVHLQGYHTLVAPLAMLGAKWKGVPYWVTFHSGGHSSRLRSLLRPMQRALLRPMLARATGLVGVSRWEVDFFQAQLRLPSGHFHLIPNGASLPALEHRRNGARQSQGGPLLVSVGRAERYKGHQHVIAALPYLVERHPGIRLRIAGSGSYEPALKKLARELGVDARVEIGGIPGSRREEMAALLHDAALVVQLSEYESQSISVAEALALGRPVLVAGSTALRELADRGLAGMVAAGCPPRETAQAILKQLEHPPVPAAPRLPTWDDCAANMLALYRAALAGRVAGGR